MKERRTLQIEGTTSFHVIPVFFHVILHYLGNTTPISLHIPYRTKGIASGMPQSVSKHTNPLSPILLTPAMISRCFKSEPQTCITKHEPLLPDPCRFPEDLGGRQKSTLTLTPLNPVNLSPKVQLGDSLRKTSGWSERSLSLSSVNWGGQGVSEDKGIRSCVDHSSLSVLQFQFFGHGAAGSFGD